jgi:hypothetical protein
MRENRKFIQSKNNAARSPTPVNECQDFDRMFQVSCKILEIEECLKNPKIRKRKETLYKQELKSLHDLITSGRKAIAAENSRRISNATLAILRGNPPLQEEKRKAWEDEQVLRVSKMTTADIIRELRKAGYGSYKNVLGRKSAYSDRRLRKILDDKLNLTQALSCIKYL